MTDAALYLLRCTLRNRARRMLRQLRSPRYALAVLVGVAYLGLVLFGQRANPGGGVAARAVAGGRGGGRAGRQGEPRSECEARHVRLYAARAGLVSRRRSW